MPDKPQPRVPVTVIGERSARPRPDVQVDYQDDQTAKDEELLRQYKLYLSVNNPELDYKDIDGVIEDLRNNQSVARKQPQERIITSTENKWGGRALPPPDSKVTVEVPTILGFQQPPKEKENYRITPDYLKEVVANMYGMGKR